MTALAGQARDTWGSVQCGRGDTLAACSAMPCCRSGEANLGHSSMRMIVPPTLALMDSLSNVHPTAARQST